MSMPGSSGHAAGSSYLSQWDGNPDGETYFHFGISQPQIDPDIDYDHDLAFSLYKISKLVTIDDYVLENQGGTLTTKVRLRLSEMAVRQDISLEAAIQTLCRAMISPRPTGCRHVVDCLTDRSIWGIIAISPVFQTYWTACFFSYMISTGGHDLQDLSADLMRHSEPFNIPTLMVFGFAIIYGALDCIQFMQMIAGSNVSDVSDLEAFVQTAMPAVDRVFSWFSTRLPSDEQLGISKRGFEASLDEFKRQYDAVLRWFGNGDVYETERSIQNPKWMHQACSKLCNMSVAAFEVLLLSKDLLNDIMAATTGEYRSTLKNGFASLASVCGAASSGGILAQAMSTGAHVGTGLDATSGIFLFASSVAALAASRTWNSFKRSKSLRSEHLRLHAVTDATHKAWASARTMKLGIVFFHLELAGMCEFPDPQAQLQLESFVKAYNEATQYERNRGLSEAELFARWLGREVNALHARRQLLNT